jgi:hypothetical protein
MKTFNASDLAHKRTEIFKAAKADGAILQRKNTNGAVLDEFVLVSSTKIVPTHRKGEGMISIINEEVIKT